MKWLSRTTVLNVFTVKNIAKLTITALFIFIIRIIASHLQFEDIYTFDLVSIDIFTLTISALTIFGQIISLSIEEYNINTTVINFILKIYHKFNDLFSKLLLKLHSKIIISKEVILYMASIPKDAIGELAQAFMTDVPPSGNRIPPNSLAPSNATAVPNNPLSPPLLPPIGVLWHQPSPGHRLSYPRITSRHIFPWHDDVNLGNPYNVSFTITDNPYFHSTDSSNPFAGIPVGSVVDTDGTVRFPDGRVKKIVFPKKKK